MQKIKTGLFLVFSILFSTKISAQKNVETQHLLWVEYNLKCTLNPNWKIRQEIENRQYWFPFNQHQFISRTHFQRNISDQFSIAPAFTYFRQSVPHDPYADNLNVFEEFRPQMEFLYKQDLHKNIALTNRLWTEFRFFEQPTNGFKFGNTRFRYKLEAEYKVTDKLKLKGYNEILLNAGKNITYNVFDQNRIGGSVTYKHDKNFSLELGYFNWYQPRSSGVDYFNRHIVRLTLHHSLDFPIKQSATSTKIQ